MITNEAELSVVRRQLELAESALQDLQRDVRPKNEKLFHVMAEGNVELIQVLREEIAQYSGRFGIPVVGVIAENTAIDAE